MRPIKLNLNNFGPFLNETIDFTYVNNNQLFLISGKTGSGKTMIFDAIVYALFGEASTKDRKEGDLRSHFAENNMPMKVEFEFKLRNHTFKIERQGAFIKKGNKNKTLGQLAVYQQEKDQYVLRESKINNGNQYIKQLLGVNAEQFRQLFILPQGEFKRFLLSKSSEKQEILRTLFNSQRFEEIQKHLTDDVKEVRQHIEQQFNTLENFWKEIETFDDDNLYEYKMINARQMNHLIEVLPEFEQQAIAIQKDLKQQKESNQELLNQAEIKLNDNVKLKESLKQLEAKREEYNLLLLNKDEIKNKIKRIKEINEVRPIANLLDSKENLISKNEKINIEIQQKKQYLKELEEKFKKSIDELDLYKINADKIKQYREFVDKTKVFYDKSLKYSEAYNHYKLYKEELSKLDEQLKSEKNKIIDIQNQLKQRQPNYKKSEYINEEIYDLKNEIKTLKQNEQNKKDYDELSKRKAQKQAVLKETECELANLIDKYETIDKTNIHLNDKREMILQIQSSIQLGDTCPICGSHIDTIEEHINFEELSEREKQLTELEAQRNKLKESKIKYESELQYIDEQLLKYDLKSIELTDYKTLELEVSNKQEEKIIVEKENEAIEKLNLNQQKLEKDYHELQIVIQNKEHKLTHNETIINDFENTTGYKVVSQFVDIFNHYFNKVTEFDNKTTELEQKIQNLNSTLAVERNSKSYLDKNKNELQNDIEKTDSKIQEEMQSIGFTSLDQVYQATAQSSEKETLEEEVESFKKSKQSFELIINQLNEETRGRKPEDIEKLTEDYKNKQKNLEMISTTLNQHDYKMEFNQKKIKEIKTIIETLNNALQTQQEIFQLAEILAGKNNQKLTLENYVLIYYLERILAQANQRLALMTGQRYQLTRRSQISQGYSGLEIDVFDSHSNQSRHITSLSGGETFQASLALALGLSEIVQQESGGIALDSMFVDEGFGTLDQETLETALDTLLSLKSSGRMVGIISHVSELKQRIPIILEVITEQYQSSAQFKKQ
ncbi:exonuclease subunit SbcC [Staphylococcus caeli]|uniref:exonuclease subunit SbcC n=1 Tax=Staphylococcus caeli TaxID=2201815 RepID=UPI003F578E04